MNKEGISVVIPSYNAAAWLPSTINKIEAALKHSGIMRNKIEIIVVDDGSTDDTPRVVLDLAKHSKFSIVLINQKNQGRYVARKTGVKKAKFGYIWFIDTRVYVGQDSLKYVLAEQKKSKESVVWNAHVNVNKKGNIIARFMDAITFIGWRRYFSNPRRCSYGLKDFDYYPKGTTSFLAPKKAIISAMKDFEKESRDIKHSSDDTHLIRIIAQTHQINLSPEFSCIYHARTSIKGFTGQAFYRGQTFVDGFFRPGTRFYLPLQIFLTLSALSLLAIILSPILAVYLAGLLLFVWICGFFAALLLGVNIKDSLSLFILSPIFSITYGLGVWLAVLKKGIRNIRQPSNRGNLFAILSALIFFTISTSFFYLGTSVSSCTTSLASGPGDQTGLIWLNSTVNAPLWGETKVTNAPYGESLQSATHILGMIEYVLYWIAAQIVGPVCGYNLFTAGGLIFSAMIVFLFTRSITKRNDVALLAGFAATFTPYLQIKTGVHPSYAFFGVFVLAIWASINLWKKPSKKTAVVLGVLISSFFFTDPYFILLGGVVIFGIFITLLSRLVFLFIRAKNQEAQKAIVWAKARIFIINSLIVGIVVSICALLPLVLVQMQHGDEIEKEVSSVRSDIKQEAFTYSARPAEYLLPSLHNPYIGEWGQQLQLPDFLTRKAHGSNPAEDSVTLSITILALSTITVGYLAASLMSKSLRDKYKRDVGGYYLPVAILVVVGFLALITSFPPKTNGFMWPADIITDHITIWRVFARLAVVVAFCLAILAAIGVAIGTSGLSKKVRILIVALLMIIIGFEYLTFTPMNDKRSWSYHQVHPFYTWLKQQKNVDTIAEYPLNEPGLTGVSIAYFRDQFIHKKKFINAFRAASPQAPLRNGIRDLSDPQTASVLSTLGVDLVVVHAEDKKQIPAIEGLEIVDWNKSSDDPDSIYVEGKMWVYRVTAEKDRDNLVLMPGRGFFPLARINSTYTEAGYVLHDLASLSIFDLRSGLETNPNGRYEVTLKTFSSDNAPELKVSQSGREVWRGAARDYYQEIKFTIDGKSPIHLEKVGGKGSDGIIITDIDMDKL